MASVGLCVITKEFDSELYANVVEYLNDGNGVNFYIDKIYVQVNGSIEAYKTAVDTWGNTDTFDISYFDWDDNFANARNALLSKVETEYWLWCDADDLIKGYENIPKVVDHMEATGVEITFAPYEYMTDDKGVVTELQLRERIIRTSLKGKWHGVIHETFIPETAAVRETTDLVVWKHVNPDVKDSMIRNRRILEAEYHNEPRDPRIVYYLGLNYGMDKHYREAIECFKELIDTGGWDEERYRAWLQIFSCLFELNEYQQAINAALMATTELPDWPDAYYMLQQVYYQLDQHEKSLEWFHVARLKPAPETDSARNPVVTVYQPLRLAAYSYMALGQPHQAMTLVQQLLALQPDYDMGNLKPLIVQAVNEANAIEAAKNLIAFTERYDGHTVKVLEALPAPLRADVRLTSERRRLIPGKQWPKGSVVFYCGQSFETWGPDTLDKGMGGSEEAVVYLARELAKQGLNVSVYNQRSDAMTDTAEIRPSKPFNTLIPVHYHAWTEINPNDTFDVFVAWRSPAGLADIKARVKLCDLHDIMPQELIYENLPHVDKYLFKSQWHRELYPDVPDDKAVVIGNGISREQFK